MAYKITISLHPCSHHCLGHMSTAQNYWPPSSGCPLQHLEDRGFYIFTYYSAMFFQFSDPATKKKHGHPPRNLEVAEASHAFAPGAVRATKLETPQQLIAGDLGEPGIFPKLGDFLGESPNFPCFLLGNCWVFRWNQWIFMFLTQRGDGPVFLQPHFGESGWLWRKMNQG